MLFLRLYDLFLQSVMDYKGDCSYNLGDVMSHFTTTLETLYRACQQQPEDQDDLFFISYASTSILRCRI